MSDSTNNMNDLAAQYMELWQKQLKTQGSEKMVDDAIKMANQFQEQSSEMMKQLDSPEKQQQWMNTWTETWKEQFKDGQDPASQFAELQKNWAETLGNASGNAQPSVDELEKRIATLEERVAELESQLKK
jgi:polyhydroxyalkanoate synthesis regulator phasin